MALSMAASVSVAAKVSTFNGKSVQAKTIRAPAARAAMKVEAAAATVSTMLNSTCRVYRNATRATKKQEVRGVAGDVAVSDSGDSAVGSIDYSAKNFRMWRKRV